MAEKKEISQIIGDLLGSAIIDQTEIVTDTKDEIVDDVFELFIAYVNYSEFIQTFYSYR